MTGGFSLWRAELSGRRSPPWQENRLRCRRFSPCGQTQKSVSLVAHALHGTEQPETNPPSAKPAEGFALLGGDFLLFGLHHHLHVRGHFAMQLHRNVELARLLQRLVQVHLAAIDLETLRFKLLRDVR